MAFNHKITLMPRKWVFISKENFHDKEMGFNFKIPYVTRKQFVISRELSCQGTGL